MDFSQLSEYWEIFTFKVLLSVFKKGLIFVGSTITIYYKKKQQQTIRFLNGRKVKTTAKY